ncbi:MAG TPA: PrgI family protein [Candidatus Dormibacteraeota bacterium]|nr:PrgI family protein [Candidatus Dormibacteraeota bacterium]
MPARIPLDVDLEDRLLYGLTPTRLAYIVVALLAGFAIWSSAWSPLAVRASAALLVVGTGSVVSWGRRHGRPADVWLVDIVLFAVRTRRLKWNVRWPIPRRRAETLSAAT